MHGFAAPGLNFEDSTDNKCCTDVKLFKEKLTRNPFCLFFMETIHEVTIKTVYLRQDRATLTLSWRLAVNSVHGQKNFFALPLLGKQFHADLRANIPK